MKLLRKFKKFTKDSKSSEKINLKYLLPPMKIVDKNKNKIEFKSFNTQFLIWFFNQEGVSELFQKFIKEENNNVIKDFITEYNLKDNNTIEKLKEYLINMPELYNSDEKKSTLDETQEFFDVTSFNQSGSIEVDKPDFICIDNNNNNNQLLIKKDSSILNIKKYKEDNCYNNSIYLG